MSLAHAPEPREAPDRAEIEARANPQALVLHEAIRLEGEEELARPARSLVLSGLAAGLSMGFSLAGMGLIQAHLPDAPWRPLVASLGYAFGFLIVILGRQQLFTENTLTVVLPLLHRPGAGNLLRVVRLWTIVFATNIAGTLLFAAAAAWTEAFSPEAKAAFGEIGRHAAERGTWPTLVRAVFAGWLIALLVWITPALGHARILAIVALSYLIALGHFAHVIAGSAEVAFVALVGDVGWDAYALGFLLPALAGNVLGGVILVALLNHGQVRAET